MPKYKVNKENIIVDEAEDKAEKKKVEVELKPKTQLEERIFCGQRDQMQSLINFLESATISKEVKMSDEKRTKAAKAAEIFCINYKKTLSATK